MRTFTHIQRSEQQKLEIGEMKRICKTHPASHYTHVLHSFPVGLPGQLSHKVEPDDCLVGAKQIPWTVGINATREMAPVNSAVMASTAAEKAT